MAKVNTEPQAKDDALSTTFDAVPPYQELPVRPSAGVTRHPKPVARDYAVRIALLVIECLGLILLGVLLSTVNQAYADDIFFFVYLGMTALAFGFLVSLGLTLGMIAYRRRSEGKPHPGCVVGWDLVAWMFLLSIAILLSIVVAFANQDITCDYHLDTKACSDVTRLVLGCEITGTILIWLAAIIHFYVFVRACIAVDRLRIGKKALALQKNVDRQGEFELASRTPGRDIERP